MQFMCILTNNVKFMHHLASPNNRHHFADFQRNKSTINS